jgi:small basic protein
VNLENVQRDDWILGGVALLLVIDLLFLPWFSISVGPFSATLTATDDPSGWLGILAVLVAIALIADLAIERLSPQTTLPQVTSRTHTRFILACVTAVFVALKFLFHIHFSDFGFGFWAAVLLTIALVYFAVQARNAGDRAARVV